MSLETPERIRSLQRKLYCKAKAEPAFRCYLLYDKIHRGDILNHAYALARANAGGPGLHGCGRCRSVEVLRQHSALRASQIGGAPHRRSACALADQDVVEGAGRGDGWGW